jgi:hypothetical protein
MRSRMVPLKVTFNGGRRIGAFWPTEPWVSAEVNDGSLLTKAKASFLLRPIVRQGTNEPAHGDA